MANRELMSCIPVADITEEVWAKINADEYYILDKFFRVWEVIGREVIDGRPTSTLVLQKEGEEMGFYTYLNDMAGDGQSGIVDKNGEVCEDLTQSKFKFKNDSYIQYRNEETKIEKKIKEDDSYIEYNKVDKEISEPTVDDF